jgi:hypothetical protein
MLLLLGLLLLTAVAAGAIAVVQRLQLLLKMLQLLL